MAYEINAWVENGAPRLQILDADSHSVRLAWRADNRHDGNSLQSLFRELLLLSLVDCIGRSDRCMGETRPGAIDSPDTVHTQQLQRNISQDT